MKLFLILFISFWCLNGFAQSNPGGQYQSHNFQYLTGVLNAANQVTSPVANAWNSVSPPRDYSLSVTTTASGWNVILEGSLDNSNWVQVATTNSAVGVFSTSVPKPMLYLRLKETGLSGASSVTATAIGVAY